MSKAKELINDMTENKTKSLAELMNAMGRAYNELRTALSIASANDFTESEKALKSFIDKDMKKINKVISSQN